MPRCHSCGAEPGASLTSRSNPDAESATRPASKSSTARSKIACGRSEGCACDRSAASPSPSSSCIERIVFGGALRRLLKNASLNGCPSFATLLNAQMRPNHVIGQLVDAAASHAPALLEKAEIAGHTPGKRELLLDQQ